MVFENPIFVVEKIYYDVKRGLEVSEDVIRKAGILLGTPFKRVDVFLSRYEEVFTKFIEKRCCEAREDYKMCIYSWNRKRSFKSFPVSNYATGTIILFRDEEPVETVLTPLPKAIDYIEGSEPVSPDKIPLYVSPRIDGWQVNLYYDKLLNRWIFSTRYVLHNMYFSRGRLVIDRYGEISNPIVSIADELASQQDLYKKINEKKGWIFIFSLLGPEPAILSPPYPVAPDLSKYQLYLIAARDLDGKLVPGETVAKEIDWRYYPSSIKPRRISELYNEIKDSLSTRSYVAWIETGEKDPMLIELSSKYYYDAMMIKHMYDAKSAAVLCSEGLCDKIRELIDQEEYREKISMIEKMYKILTDKLSETKDLEETAEKITDLIKEIKGSEVINREEILKEIKSGNYKRLSKKILSIILENISIASQEFDEKSNLFIQRILSI